MNAVLDILKAAGFRAGTDHPAGGFPQITGAVVAVGLAGLEPGKGTAEFLLRVLSPGSLGGWHCQNTGAAVARALEEAGLSAALGEMTCLPGPDCFCTELRARMEIHREGELWRPGKGWSCFWDGAEIVGVSEFSAEEDLNRRLVGGGAQQAPVAVSPGQGGWRLKLVQKFPTGMEEQMSPAEPFALSVTGAGKTELYSGCCWNRTKALRTREGLLVERQGFALGREVM